MISNIAERCRVILPIGSIAPFSSGHRLKKRRVAWVCGSGVSIYSPRHIRCTFLICKMIRIERVDRCGLEGVVKGEIAPRLFWHAFISFAT
jgi:hypothetical protein